MRLCADSRVVWLMNYTGHSAIQGLIPNNTLAVLTDVNADAIFISTGKELMSIATYLPALMKPCRKFQTLKLKESLYGAATPLFALPAIVLATKNRISVTLIRVSRISESSYWKTGALAYWDLGHPVSRKHQHF